jgi:hypothetical protein
LLGRYQFKEALTSFRPHHAAPKTANAVAAVSDSPNHAHLRRACLPKTGGCSQPAEWFTF